MVRVHVQLTEEQHRRLREEAFRRGTSISALVREWTNEGLGLKPRSDKDVAAAMAFVGAGRDSATDVSERHDEYLAGLLE